MWRFRSLAAAKCWFDRLSASLVLTIGLASGAGLLPGAAAARGSHVEADSAGAAVSKQVSASQLPVQGRELIALILQGGPFRYDKDGAVFGNRERALPGQPRGFYREYTVRTPGHATRGARRIVCGGVKPAQPEACFYTDDHYASFRKIVPLTGP